MGSATKYLKWYRDDAGSEKRIKFWLDPANRSRNQFNNLVIKTDDPNEWIINATTVKRAIEAIKGMVVQQSVTATVKGENEDSVWLERLIASRLTHLYKKLRKRGWYSARLENILIEGVGCITIEFDFTRWDAKNPNGSFVVRYHNPRNVFLDCRAETLDEVSRWTIIHRMTREEAVARFPAIESMTTSHEMNEGRDYPTSSPKKSSSDRYYAGETTEQEFVEIAQAGWKNVSITKDEKPQRIEEWWGCYYYGEELVEEPKPFLAGVNPLVVTIAHNIEGSPYGNGQAQPVLDTNVAISALYTVMMQRTMKTQGYVDVVNTSFVKDKERIDEINAALLGQTPVNVIAQEFVDHSGIPVDAARAFTRINSEPMTQQELSLIQALSEEARAALAVQNAQVGIFQAGDPAQKSAMAQQLANTQLQDLFDALQDGDTDIFNILYKIDKKVTTYETTIPSLNSMEREFLTANLVLDAQSAMTYPLQDGESLWEMPDMPGYFVVNPLWAGDFDISANINYNTPMQQEQRIAHAEAMISKGFLSPEDYASAFPEYEDNPRFYLERARAFAVQQSMMAQQMMPPAQPETQTKEQVNA